jgi:hydroxymethylglutaryl-CoA synthase
VPPYRVALQDWCEWNGADWRKVREVIGSGFRLPGPGQNVYTMAAAAVLRLIEAYEVDPSRVRFLALGTESSTDGSAGAIIVKGLVNQALAALGRPPLSRHCEVPELKHACLGGIYALKSALRFLATDGAGARAIVVCADRALYPLGSSGEPTQGAGAVALLLDARPMIGAIELAASGASSDDRRLDFRKPLRRLPRHAEAPDAPDAPVYNGRYSLNCYLDAVLRALEDMHRRRKRSPAASLRRVTAAFLHRPYQRLPETAWGLAWLAALASGGRGARAELHELCRLAQVPAAGIVGELCGAPDLTMHATPARIREDAFPTALAALRKLRRTASFRQQVLSRLRLGSRTMRELGNLYNAALPAWLAAGLAEAALGDVDLAGREVLLLGYGSGDASEALPMKVVRGWRQAARRIGLPGALRPRIRVTHRQYLALRRGQRRADLAWPLRRDFVVTRIGRSCRPDFQDLGVEYYRFVP